MGYFQKRAKATLNLLLGTLPSLGFVMLFIAIIMGATFEARYGYDVFGMMIIVMGIALAMCFYISPTLSNISWNSASITNFHFEGNFYELVKFGNNDYSFGTKGGMALAYAVICFFKNLLVCPIVVLMFIPKFIRILVDENFCESAVKENIKYAGVAKKAIIIVLSIAMLMSYTTWIVTFCQYKNHAFENNISLQYSSIERSVDSLNGNADSGMEIIMLNINFKTNAKTNDLKKIVADISITDGVNTITAQDIKLSDGSTAVQIKTGGYAPVGSENNTKFRNLNLSAAKITVFIRTLEYEKRSISYKQGQYVTYQVPLV